MRTPAEREALLKSILKLCSKKSYSLGELASALSVNKNTLRAKYIYVLVAEGKLQKTHQYPHKSNVRYFC